ncbi:MAG: transglutaminase-like domain-containing protein [Candidatus Glassbacteria bacterium]
MEWRRWFILTCILALACAVSLARAATGELRTHTQIVTAGDIEYAIEVAGTIDPENVEIRIENLGDTPVVDPRLTANGLYDWFDVASLAAEITRGCTTDEEKAMAIWEWVHWRRFQRSPNDESALQPVRAMNGYGYGICGHTASWIKALCRAAGLEARVWEIAGHTVSEVFYNGGWHMLDGNVKVFYLARDNRTVAGMAELMKDAWLIERSIHPRDPWVRGNDVSWRNREFVHYLTTERDNWISDGYDSENRKNYSMSMTLRPGEILTRWWEPRLAKFESPDKDPLAPVRYANGQLVWEPDLKKIDLLDYCHFERWDNISSRQRDGFDPAVHVAEFQDEIYSRPSRFDIPTASPYPVVGSRFQARVFKSDQGRDRLTVNFAGPGWGGGDEVYNFQWGGGTENIDLWLDPFVYKNAPVYTYRLVFLVASGKNSGRQERSGLESFRLVTDLQVSPHGLPALSLGRNVIRWRDSSPGERKVRITYTWREHSDNTPPGVVDRAVSPDRFDTLTPTLEWQPARDPDKGDGVADYQVMLSLRPDCRWPLSPATYRNVGSADCRWQVSESFLLPATTYYWKVRARDSRGAVGKWGDVFSFKTAEKIEQAKR